MGETISKWEEELDLVNLQVEKFKEELIVLSHEKQELEEKKKSAMIEKNKAQKDYARITEAKGKLEERINAYIKKYEKYEAENMRK